MDLSGVGIWSHQLRYGDIAAAADAAAELEDLGFQALWIPDVGGTPVVDSVGHLLSATNDIVIATGILNLWMNEPADVAASYAALSAAHGDRFLLGIGVSHAPLIDATEPGRYANRWRRHRHTSTHWTARRNLCRSTAGCLRHWDPRC